ncbi:MAG: Flp pilus assembly protein CpaB [Candidatus Nanopelagicales bacterium]
MHPSHPLRIIRRNRRAVAALLAGAAVLLTARAVGGHPQTVPVVVASRALAAGAQLQAADLQVRQYPAELAPKAALADPAELVGQVSAVSVSAGEVFNDARLLGPTLAADPADPRRAPMPLRLADAQAAKLLRPGNRLDILAAPLPGDEGSPGRARVVARNVLVLAVAGQVGGGTGLFAAEGAGTDSGALILISASSEQALLLAGAQDRDLTFLVR